MNVKGLDEFKTSEYSLLIAASNVIGMSALTTRSKSPDAIAGCRGFTLIELLVVLVILGLFSGMAVISIGDNFARELRGEAERFQSIVIAAIDEAIYTSSDLGFVLSKEGYILLKYDRITQGWVSFNNKVFKLHEFDEQMQISWTIEGFSRQQGDTDSRFGGDGDKLFGDEDENQFVEINDTRDHDDENNNEVLNLTPQILMLSSGELTAFTVDFFATMDVQNKTVFQVVSDGFSRPTIKNVSEQ